MVKIVDEKGKLYYIPNLRKFKKHLMDYHSHNGKGDNSLHEENGHLFRITRSFYEYIMSVSE